MRTHLLGQCIQVREGLEGIRLVCELLEQWRVLDGVDELVGDLRGQAPRRGREFMGDAALRGSILILVPQRPRYDEALGDVPQAECPEHVFTAVGLIGWLCQGVERGLGGRTVGSRRTEAVNAFTRPVVIMEDDYYSIDSILSENQVLVLFST